MAVVTLLITEHPMVCLLVCFCFILFQYLDLDLEKKCLPKVYFGDEFLLNNSFHKKVKQQIITILCIIFKLGLGIASNKFIKTESYFLL